MPEPAVELTPPTPPHGVSIETLHADVRQLSQDVATLTARVAKAEARLFGWTGLAVGLAELVRALVESGALG